MNKLLEIKNLSLSYKINNKSLQILKNVNIDLNYKEAISNYEKILENGFFSEDLYLNLGNAYFHESNFGKARWSYEMGLKLNPINSDLKNNNNVNKYLITNSYLSLFLRSRSLISFCNSLISSSYSSNASYTASMSSCRPPTWFLYCSYDRGQL